MILINDSYPVFEADQVLSQKHLNRLISYLEEQDRASRTQLLGMGVVCGLEISKPNATTVAISCGTGITSLGYLVPLEDSNFTHFKNTTISENFLNPDIEQHPYLENLYQYTQMYQPFENCMELLEADSDDEDKQLLTEEVLDNKVVMLLVEALLIDEKNCITLDCADKGKRLEFKIRPLLIDADLLVESEFDLEICNRIYFDNLRLPRYSVPKATLTTTADVLNAYNSLISGSKGQLNDAVHELHNHYADAFSSLDNYIVLNNVEGRINTVHTQTQDGIYLQYVWDWMNDLTATYNEIAQFHACNPSLCCPDKGKFPFHVLLGSAEFATEEILPGNDLFKFRTPFIKTGILAAEEKDQKETLKGLLEKLIRLVTTFDLNLEITQTRGIKITPSHVGRTPLSERAIPYYYSEIDELNTKWSPALTMEGLNQNILSYHSDEYNTTNPSVTDPLEYDVEPYNFFRVEGHLGRNYSEALTEIIAQQEGNRLPFKVIGLNAVDYSNNTIDISNQTEIWDDMELDYDLAKEKTYNITEYVIDWIKDNKDEIQEHYPAMTDQTITNLESILVETRDLLSEDLADFLPNYEAFYEVFENLNDLFLFHRRCIKISGEIDEHAIIEDLVDHLDEINNLFLEDPFTIIHEEANRRWENSFKETFLSSFLEKHPGITHEAGVTKGGTFILVYADSSVFETDRAVIGTVALVERIKSYKRLFRFSEVEEREIQSKNVVRKRALAKGRKPAEQTTGELAKHEKAMKSRVMEAAKKDMQGLPKATRAFMEERFAKAFDSRIVGKVPGGTPGRVTGEEILVTGTRNPVRRIPERVIIADFYLPYICCSSGNNINIVLPTQDTEPIVADFEGVDFDENDFFTNDQ
ncbi:hypothetical protein POV27_14945 [Aureisphaera galaxeae]|uniref:hypothetical protein n=1 Tax=Aureisphaera galaxeae TaxID=1538023 RepID=UPI00234FEC05|nr:hypothetical protein [Aureisphaera galaxeae]MDC8005358.1 hypothetical protein [Aureisphaera galaxeae]